MRAAKNSDSSEPPAGTKREQTRTWFCWLTSTARCSAASSCLSSPGQRSRRGPSTSAAASRNCFQERSIAACSRLSRPEKPGDTYGGAIEGRISRVYISGGKLEA